MPTDLGILSLSSYSRGFQVSKLLLYCLGSRAQGRCLVLPWSFGPVWSECMGSVLYELWIYTFSFPSTLTRLPGPAAEKHPHTAPITLQRNHCAWLPLNMIVRIHFNLMTETWFHRPLGAFSHSLSPDSLVSEAGLLASWLGYYSYVVCQLLQQFLPPLWHIN